jgi:hypothetical protein
VRGQQRAVDARLVVVAFEAGARDQLDQVAVALEILRQEHQVEIVAILVAELVGHPARADVRLHAEYRLHAGAPGERVKVDGSVQVAVIGQCHGAHSAALDGVHDVPHRRQAVQQRELAVDVQVHEVLRRRGRRRLGLGRRRFVRRLVRLGIDVVVFVPPGAHVVEGIKRSHG